MTEAEIKGIIANAKAHHEEIYVINWGATMTLADFFIIRNVYGSKKQIALKLSKVEYGEFGVSERTIPTEKVCTNELYAVRLKEHDKYTGLASDLQIHYGFSGWKTATKWDGTPEYQNTCD